MKTPSRSDFAARRLRALGVSVLFFAVLWVVVEGWLPVLSTTGRRLAGEDVGPGSEDYVAYYAAGALALRGDGDLIYDVEAIRAEETATLGRPASTGVLPFFNPPYVAALFAPLTSLPLTSFLAILVATNVALVAWAGALLRRIAQPAGRGQTTLFWIVYLSMYGLAWTILQGQVSLLLLIGWAGFAWFQMQGNQRTSGFALALGLVKPQMIIVPIAILVWKRQWQALAPVAGISALFAAVSVVVSGPAVLIEYPRFVMESAGWEGDGINVSRMFGLNSLLHMLTGAPPSALLLAAPILVTLGVAVCALRGTWDRENPRFALQLSTMLVASLLINAHLYLQDLVLLGLVFALVAGSAARTDRLMLALWGVLMIGLWSPPVDRHGRTVRGRHQPHDATYSGDLSGFTGAAGEVKPAARDTGCGAGNLAAGGLAENQPW